MRIGEPERPGTTILSFAARHARKRPEQGPFGQRPDTVPDDDGLKGPSEDQKAPGA